MGQIQERGYLRVGVPAEGFPPFVTREGRDSKRAAPGYSGFAIDLVGELEAALGLEEATEFVAVQGDPLASAEEVDVLFAPVPATEALAKDYSLTHPYWVGHQRLLVPSGSGMSSIDDLFGADVCSILDEETGVPPDELNPNVTNLPSDVSGCAQALRKKDVIAVTAPDVELMSVWSALSKCDIEPCAPADRYTIAGDDLTTAGYCAILPSGAKGWTSFVNEVWAETDFEGRWLEFYERWIAPFGIEIAEPPDMRVEEAAGLYPS